MRALRKLILGETWTLVRRRLGHATALRVVDAILAVPALDVVAVDARMEKEAWREIWPGFDFAAFCPR